jgi:peptidoglycan/LPS O-acetylase OafA/YrhL
MNRPKAHIEFLDEIRGIAIIAVFIFHSLRVAFKYDHLPWGTWFSDFNVSKTFLVLLPFSLGSCGVAIFFVVSGFCIHLSFMRKPNWHDFIVRRFFRIYPPYFFATILFAVFVPWSRIHGILGLASLGSHLALVHNFNTNFFFSINSSFWSIAVEAQLYFLYPLLLVVVSRMGWHHALIYVAAIEIVLRIIFSVIMLLTGDLPPLWFLGLPFLYCYSWSIGAAIAEAYHLDYSIPFANHSLIAWGGIAVVSNFVKPLAAFSFLFFSILTATAIAKLLRKKHLSSIFPVFCSKYLRTIGLWSYSIYLLHHPFLSLARVVAEQFPVRYLHSLFIFSLCLCLWFPIVLLSALWYRTFEITSIAISKKFINKSSEYLADR